MEEGKREIKKRMEEMKRKRGCNCRSRESEREREQAMAEKKEMLISVTLKKQTLFSQGHI